MSERKSHWATKRPGVPLAARIPKKWSTAEEIGVTVAELQTLRAMNQIEFRFKPGRRGFPTTNIMQWRRRKI